MIENLQCRAFLSMVGALLITMGVGLMYLWGIISVYATSYYRIVSEDPNFTEFKADIVFPLQLLGQVQPSYNTGYLDTDCRQDVQEIESEIRLYDMWGGAGFDPLHVVLQRALFDLRSHVRADGRNRPWVHLHLPDGSLLFLLS